MNKQVVSRSYQKQAYTTITDFIVNVFSSRVLTPSPDLIRKVIETYATRILLIGVGLLITVIIARFLGPSGRGLYAVAATTGLLGVQFGNLGLHASNVYVVSQDPKSLSPLVGNSLVASFVVGGFIAATLAVLFNFVPSLISLSGPLLFLALAWIPFGLAFLLLEHLMLGVHDVRGYNILEVSNKTILLLLIVCLVVARRTEVTSFLGAALASMIISCVWAWNRLRTRFVAGSATSLPLFRGSVRYAAKAYLAALFAFLVLRADLFMVQHILGALQAGYYSIAGSMADYVSLLSVVVGTILFPKLSAMTEIKAKLRLTRQAVWGTIGLLLPMLAAASLLAKPAIRVLFGSAFFPAALPFLLLMPGMLFLGINTVAVQFLNSIGYPSSVVVIWALCAFLNIGLNLWVIPRYGIVGASVVSSISYFLAFFFILLIIRRTAVSKGVSLSPTTS